MPAETTPTASAKKKATTATVWAAALTRQDFASICQEVEREPHVLWEALSSGYTLMHLAMRVMTLEQYRGARPVTLSTTTSVPHRQVLLPSHFIAGHYARPPPPMPTNSRSNTLHRTNNDNAGGVDWWQWLLSQASCRPRMFGSRDAGGDACVDIMWQTWYAPSDAAQKWTCPFVARFATSLEHVLSSPSHIAQLQATLAIECGDRSKYMSIDLVHPSEVLIVARFWRALTMLQQAAVMANNDENISVVSFLAQSGSCAEPLAKLALVLASTDELNAVDEFGHSLWHLWAAAPSVHQNGNNIDGMMQPMLDHLPRQLLTHQRDHQGRLPIHLALEHGQPLVTLQRIWRASPGVLAWPDPIAALPVFGLVQCAARREQSRARQVARRRPPHVTLAEWLDAYRRDGDGEEKQQEALRLAALSFVYETIRMLPSAATTSYVRENKKNSSRDSSI